MITVVGAPPGTVVVRTLVETASLLVLMIGSDSTLDVDGKELVEEKEAEEVVFPRVLAERATLELVSGTAMLVFNRDAVEVREEGDAVVFQNLAVVNVVLALASGTGTELVVPMVERLSGRVK